VNRNLAVLLLFAVCFTHYAYDPICAIFPSLAGQARGIFYVLRGFEGTVLFLVILRLRPILWPVCTWGAFEEAETAVCRLSAGFPATPIGSPWNGLCSDITHWPLSMLGIVIAAILITRVAKEPQK